MAGDRALPGGRAGVTLSAVSVSHPGNSGTEYIRPYGGLAGALRAGLRSAGLVVVTLVTLLTWGLLALWPRDAAGRAALRRGVSRRWAATCCRVMGARVRVQGRPPAGPGFLVSNHVSYLDIPVLMSLTGCSFVAKREIADWPVIGWLARVGGTLFVNRSGGRDTAQTLQQMHASRERGDLVAFFPEGTTSDGRGVQPFRSGLLALASDHGVPVEAAAVRYSTAAEVDPRLALAWTGQQDFVPHAWRVLTLPGFEARVSLAEATLMASDRKLLARKLHGAVSDLHAGLDLPEARPLPGGDAAGD
ncbi:MAG: lysophospholipid acyltransferase family protein [Gammaproteobacteria bacterium]